VIVLTVALSAIVVLSTSGRSGIPWLQDFQAPSDPLIVISTRTPTPVPMRTSKPTRTRILVVAPTRHATATATFTPAPLLPLTPTPTSGSRASSDIPTRTATLTSTVDPLPTDTPELSTETSTPRVLVRPPIPAPVLKEPLAGVTMPSARVVRFKFVWSRELESNERVLLYIRSVEQSGEFAWGASGEDILHGGGKISKVEGGVLYEINAGFGDLPSGKAAWKVAIVLDTPTGQRQVSPWSEERPIVNK